MNDIQQYQFELEGTWQEEDDAQKLSLKRNYNTRQFRERNVTSEHFSFPPSNLASGAAVMAALQWFGLFPYNYDIRYISWLLLWNFWLLFEALHI